MRKEDLRQCGRPRVVVGFVLERGAQRDQRLVPERPADELQADRQTGSC